MQKKQWMCLFAGLLALMLAACNNDETTSCSVDADCDTTELCHPNVKLCVKTCTSSDDCPASAKTCGTLATAGGEKKICQCSTDYWCNDGKADGDLVCDETYKVCVPKGTEVGEDPDATIGDTCDSSKPQPDVCTYGLVCNSSNKCEAPPSSSACSTKFPQLSWDPSNPTGPIIHSVKSLGIRTSTFCDPPNQRWEIEVRAYSTGSALARDNNPPFKLYKSPTDILRLYVGGDGGGSISSTDGWVNEGDNDHAKIIVSLCNPIFPYNAGLAFDNGNTVCVSHN